MPSDGGSARIDSLGLLLCPIAQVATPNASSRSGNGTPGLRAGFFFVISRKLKLFVPTRWTGSAVVSDPVSVWSRPAHLPVPLRYPCAALRLSLGSTALGIVDVRFISFILIREYARSTKRKNPRPKGSDREPSLGSAIAQCNSTSVDLTLCDQLIHLRSLLGMCLRNVV